ncbi:MAG: rod shape-determining protein MreC [Betaproteobacteria bacterium]|nr:rod shape-determining protein MreC [Betaproteobacteria bacterium]
MPLGTLDRSPPPFFKQGPSALSKLAFFSALSLFLMVADVRFNVMQPVRSVVATALYPLQWVAMLPVRLAGHGAGYFTALDNAQAAEAAARTQMIVQAQRAGQGEQLMLENARLRQLMGLRDQLKTQGMTAEVLYDAADPFTRKVLIDKGVASGVTTGSPVIDESGLLGQVTRVMPLISEVTLVIDRDHATPVLNTRTGARSVAFGDPLIRGGVLELRFMAGNADVQADDVLTTSGIDGVYPPGLPVARVDRVERRADSAFARIYCMPQANVASARHVLVLQPVSDQLPPRPEPEPVRPTGKKGGRP